jgi:hypothetical protein
VHIAGIEWAKQKLAAMQPEWSPAQRAAFCICLPFRPKTWEIIDRLDDATVSHYWKTVSFFNVKENDIERVVRRLLEHSRPEVAVVLLRHHIRRPGLSVALVVDVLEGLLRCPGNETERRRLSAHDLSDLLALVSASQEVEESRIAALEWAFLPALGRHFYTPKVLQREMARSPELFAQVVALVYRAEGEEPRESSKEERVRAERAYELLQSWRWQPLPGVPENGACDSKALRDWVLDARKILQAQGRLAIGDHTIGEILSTAPGGDDGAWPDPAIRDLIEELASGDFEQGLVIGLLNSEGVSCRNLNEGGTRERKTAAEHGRFASIVGSKWPRTAAMLRGIHDQYVSRATDEDRRAELREDLSR